MAKLSSKDYDREGCSRLGSISNRGVEYRHAKGSVSSLNYHFVFCPKRRKAVLIEGVAKRLQEIIFEVVSEHGWKLIALEIMPDYVHFFVNVYCRENKLYIRLLA